MENIFFKKDNYGCKIWIGFATNQENEENLALISFLKEKFFFNFSTGKKGEIIFPIKTRREFSLLPAFIRYALNAQYELKVFQFPDNMVESNSAFTYSLSDNENDFWREIAMAQTYFA